MVINMGSKTKWKISPNPVDKTANWCGGACWFAVAPCYCLSDWEKLGKVLESQFSSQIRPLRELFDKYGGREKLTYLTFFKNPSSRDFLKNWYRSTLSFFYKTWIIIVIWLAVVFFFQLCSLESLAKISKKNWFFKEITLFERILKKFQILF
jgi:hypothetical protein